MKTALFLVKFLPFLLPLGCSQCPPHEEVTQKVDPEDRFSNVPTLWVILQDQASSLGLFTMRFSWCMVFSGG